MRICIVYICAYIVLVCIGIYIYAHVHYSRTCNVLPRRAFFACNLCNLRSRFDRLLPPGSMPWSFAPPYLYRRPRVPLPCLLPSKLFQRSFQTVFQAVLSGLIVWRVYLHRLHRLARLNSLICGKIAVLGVGRGDYPLRQAARGATEVAK